MLHFSFLSILIAFSMTWLVIKGLSQRLLDLPTDRSSHVLPTPRGGGIAIAATTILMCSFLTIFDLLSIIPLPFIILLAAIAALGALDDFFNLGIKPRLLTQIILSALGVILCLGSSNFSTLETILIGIFLTLTLLWLVNLYNFMDGINGIAALQAICVCVTMGAILHFYGDSSEAVNSLLIVGSACAGFLYWNFPKAKIFMGDTGSLFLGFGLGLIAVWTSLESIEMGTAWLIMLAVFITDATYTLLVRALTGQKFYLPHRSHSYQKLAVIFKSHAKVTLLVCAINALWLFPLALLTITKTINPAIALIAAYGPLVVIAYKLKAGTN